MPLPVPEAPPAASLPTTTAAGDTTLPQPDPAGNAAPNATDPPALRDPDRPLTQPPQLANPDQNLIDGTPAEVIAEALDPLPEGSPSTGGTGLASGQPPGPGETIGQIPDQPGFRLLFEAGSDELSAAAGSLLNGLAQRLADNPGETIQVRAYAQSSVDRGSDARRLSLNRALVIRTFLLDRGIRATRIDIRALGDTAEGEPRDRVDLIFTN